MWNFLLCLVLYLISGRVIVYKHVNKYAKNNKWSKRWLVLICGCKIEFKTYGIFGFAPLESRTFKWISKSINLFFFKVPIKDLSNWILQIFWHFNLPLAVRKKSNKNNEVMLGLFYMILKRENQLASSVLKHFNLNFLWAFTVSW